MLRTPEATCFPSGISPISDYLNRIAQAVEPIAPVPGLIPGRIIVIESHGLQRRIRRYGSGREELTSSTLVIAVLAYLDPSRWISSGFVKTPKNRHLSRLRKTWSNPESCHNWAILQATRIMSIMETTAIQSGWFCHWICEGLEFSEIERLLAIPDDHQLIGFLCIETEVNNQTAPKGQPSPADNQFIDLNGFYGQWPLKAPESGESTS